MPPRFSLRTLLVFATMVAAACNWLVARPTVVARRFVAAINGGDYALAEVLFRDRSFVAEGFKPLLNNTLRLEARLEQRTWDDLLHAHRRIDLQYAKGSVVVWSDFVFGAIIPATAHTPCPARSSRQQPTTSR